MRKLISRRRTLKALGALAGIGLGSGTVLAKRELANAPFKAQISALRGMTKKYREKKGNNQGIERAMADGFIPMGVHQPDPQIWWLIRDRPRLADLSLRDFGSLVYIRDGNSGPLQLGGIGYSVPIEDHGANGHTPPDLFNDEGEDLQITEKEGWDLFNHNIMNLDPDDPDLYNPDTHQEPADHVGFRVAFSDQTEDVTTDISNLSKEVLFDEKNWTFMSKGEWDDVGGYEPGDHYDVDGDGVNEKLDFAKSTRYAWANAVWNHVNNPDGIFWGHYKP